MLTGDQIEKLELAEMWLEEIIHSPEFKELDIHPDLTLGDSLQGIQETLADCCPSDPFPSASTKQPWGKKLTRCIRARLGEVAILTLSMATISGCASVFCWGVSDIKAAVGYRLAPDFAAQSQIYRGLAIASFGVFLGTSILAAAVASQEER